MNNWTAVLFSSNELYLSIVKHIETDTQFFFVPKRRSYIFNPCNHYWTVEFSEILHWILLKKCMHVY